MKKLVMIVAALFAACSCQLNIFGKIEIGNGVSVQNSYDLPAFSSISSLGALDIYYTQSPEQSVVLTCDENLVEFYIIESQNGVLSVRVRPGVSITPATKSYLTVTSPVVQYISVAGSGDCVIENDLEVAGDFEYKVTGSGDLNALGCISCEKFSAAVYGSGDIDVNSVRAELAKFSLYGSGNIESKAVTADNINVSISGSGGCDLNCEDAGDVEIRITGSGSVRLFGTARSVNSKVTGSGRVQDRTSKR